MHGYVVLVKLWLDGNPDDIATVLLVNGDFKDPDEFDAVFSAVGLKQYAFIPASSPKPLVVDQWPTYAELIASGKRCAVFLDYQANTSAVPYILPEFDYFFETPYDTTDPSFDECTRDRPSDGSGEETMYIVNHFLDKKVLPGILVPDNDANFATNTLVGEAVLEHKQSCARRHGGGSPM